MPGPRIWAADRRDLELGVALDELVALDQRRQVALVGDVEEHRQAAVDEADDVQLPDREGVEVEGDRDRRDRDRPAEVADDQDRPPAEPVDPDAGRQAEQDERQELDRRRAARTRTGSRPGRSRRSAAARAGVIAVPNDRVVSAVQSFRKSGWRRRLRSRPVIGHESRSGGGSDADARRRGRARIGRVLVESVPNVSEGRRLDVVERLAEALTSVPGVYLLDRTSDASHNRSVFTIAGEHEAVAAALERLVEQAIADIDMEHAHRRAPADRRRRRHPVRPARRHDDGRLRRARAGVRRAGSPAAGTCRSTSTRRRRPAPTGSSSPTCGAASTRASRSRSPTTAASPTSGPSGCTRGSARWPWAPGRSSSRGTSTSTRTTSTSPSGSRAGSASPAAGCRGSRPTGSGSRSPSAATRSAPRSR